LNQSLDGYVDYMKLGPPAPAAFHHFIEVRGLTCVTYGRRTYEIMRYWDDDLPDWDAEDREFAHIGSFDLVVNAASAGHGDAEVALPFSLIGARAVCYDLSYGNAARRFIAWARAAKAAKALDGLGMLVEQAAESFEFWHGVRPETNTVYAELRASFRGDAED
jgi:shikimate 5-dehydrogenase